MQQLKEQEQISLVNTITLHTPATLGFAALFLTFSMATQGYQLGAATIGLTAAVAATCILCALLEFYHAMAKKEDNYNKASKSLNGLAFLFAAAGCVLVTSELGGAIIPKWVSLLPSAFLCVFLYRCWRRSLLWSLEPK